ncbi:hypothetical protein AVEN_265113-1 [Araneus ventricosus]|uniref:CCHC-type domain-containing protein n=1 Tax=Araneus ventricosus TaxID=182803 RepID=A0A4Y2NIU5_ARAVE|nr:hypothetical protein AVEN_265113-1 [Araneus ventricosus]
MRRRAEGSRERGAGPLGDVGWLLDGDLLIEVSNASQATTLSKLTTLGNLNVKVSAHKNLNFSRGVISERGLKKHTESELVQELLNQKVCGARPIQIKRDGKLIPTQHIILTFSTPELPKSIKAGYLSCPIKPYIPYPVGCFKCQKFGHSQQACRSNSKICAKCSVAGHDSSDCISDEIKCRNCDGHHTAFSKSCPRWILEKEIRATKIRKNISFAEARKLVTERTPKPGVVYSSAVKQNNKPINQPTFTECAHCGYRANTENLRKTSLQTVASTKPIFSASSLQTPREPSTSLQTASIFSPLMVNSPPKQKQSINAVKSKNITNVNRQEQIKETKAAKKARLAALKKKKNLRNNPTSKDFLKNPEKETSDLKNVDPLLNIHPSDEDLMSSVSETDSPPPSPKSSYSPFNLFFCFFTSGSSPSSQRNFIIYTDSMSALETLSHYDTQMQPVGLEILSILQCLRNKSFNIIFFWVPSHVGISGNETADAIAKFASAFFPRALPYVDIKKFFVSRLFSLWQQKWDLLTNNKLHSVKPSIGLWPILPIRQVDVKLTRLRIGHTRFTHKHLIFGERAPVCPTCHQNFTVHHILIECQSFKSHRVDHFHPSSVTLQDLVGEKHHPNIFNFLKTIGFFMSI